MEKKRIFGFRKLAGVLVACAIGVSIYSSASAQEQNNIIYQTMGGQEIEISVPWDFEDDVDVESVDLTDNPFFTGDENVTESTASNYVNNLGEVQPYMESHLDQINEVREQNNLEPLALDEELIKFATLKAADMAENQYFDHDRPGTGNVGQQYTYFLDETEDKNPANFSMSITMFGLSSNDPEAIQEEIYDYLTNDNGESNSILEATYNGFGVAYYHDEENDLYFGVQIFHTDPVEDEEAPTDEEPTDEEPTDEEPTDEEPTDEEPTDEEPTDEEPTDEEPTDEEPTDEEPTDEEPTDEEPTDGTPDFTRADAVINYQYVDRAVENPEVTNHQGIQFFTTLNDEVVDIFEASDVSDSLVFRVPFNDFEVDRIYHERLDQDLTFTWNTNDNGDNVIEITTPDLDNDDVLVFIEEAPEADPLEEQIAAATTTINELGNLSDEEAQQFITQLDSAESEDAVNAIVEEAQQLNTANDAAFSYSDITLRYSYLDLVFNQHENREYQAIELLPTVNEEAVNPFDASDVEDSYTFRIRFDEFTVNEIQNVDDASQIQFETLDSEEGQLLEITVPAMSRLLLLGDEIDQLTEERETARTTISEMQNLDDTQRADYNQRIDNAETAEEIETVLQEAAQTDADQAPDPLQDEKDAAKARIVELQYVNEEQAAEYNQRINNAESTQDINNIVEEAVSVNDEQTPDPLADAKEAAKSTVTQLEHLNDEQRAEFNTQIDNAETQEAIDTVVSDAQTLNDEQTPDPLADAKETAKNTVTQLEHLNDEQRAEFNTQIDNAETQEAIDTVVSDAQTLNEEQTPDPLQDEKDAAKARIVELQYINEDQVADYNQRINNAESTEDINSIVEEAVSVNDEQTPDPLADAKEAAKSTVGQLEHLGEEQVSEFNTQIDNAETQEAIDTVVSDAQTLNEEQTPDPLADEKEAARNTVSELEYLEENLVEDFNTRIDEAETQEEIDEVLSEAQNLNENLTPDPLADEKLAARNAIGDLEYLDDGQLSDLNFRIDAAETQEEIDTVVSDAETLNEEQTPDPLADEKEAAQNTVSQLEHLEEPQVSEFNTQIENAETQETIDTVVSDAETLNEDQMPDPLAEEKETARNTVSGLEHLNEEQVSDFNTQIDNAETQETIDTVVSDAETLNEEQTPDPLADEKESARNTVSQLEHLNEAQVSEFNTQIDNAETQEAIDTVVSDAQSLNEEQTPDPLADEKESAKNTVSQLEHLNEEQVSDFNTQIDNAETQEAIDTVVSDAQTLNEEQTPDPLADEKESAIAVISEMQYLNEEQVADYTQRVENAETAEEIQSIQSEASETDAEQAPDPLQDEKDAAKESVAGFEYLDEAQVDEFNQRIDDAESTQDINNIVEEAVSVNDEQTPDPLAEDRESARNTISEMQHLNDAQRSEYNERIDNAETAEEIENVLLEAAEDDAAQAPDPLQDEKDSARNSVSELEHLDDAQREEFNQRIDDAESTQDINNIVEEAVSVNDDQTPDPLAEDKESARNTISEMQHLDDTQRSEYNERIDNAETAEEIENVLLEAAEDDAEQAPDPLQGEKDSAKNSVAELENLDDAQREEYNQRIDDAESTQDINDIVEEAVSENDDITEATELETQKEEAKSTIDNLENLSDEEKQNLRDDVDAAESTEDIETVVTEAERLDSEATEDEEEVDPLADAKAAAKEEVLALEYLNEETLALFIQQINEADSQEMIDRLVREANEADESRQRDLEEDEVTEAEIIGGTLDESEVEDMPEPIDDDELIMSIEDSGVYIEGTVGERLTASGITLPGATVTITGDGQSFEIVAGDDGLFEGTIPYFRSGTVLEVVFTSEDGETYETTVTLVYDPTTKTVKGGSDHDVQVTDAEEVDQEEEVAGEDEQDDLPATGIMSNVGVPIAAGIALLGLGLFALFFRRR